MRRDARRYSMKDAQNMIDLAKYVQTKVYWGSSFYIDDEKQIRYREFWDLASESLDAGYSVVEITSSEYGDDIRFLK